MLDQIEELFKKKNIFFHKNQGITVAQIATAENGVSLTASILYQIIDRKTVLYLSGGSTPKSLYTKLAKEETFLPGAVGQVDERYGMPLHESSNQLMIRETGFLRYLEMRDIPFYPILKGKSREETAIEYDEKIRELNAVYQKSIAIMGIGTDGHTAGIPAQSSKFKVQSSKFTGHDLVAEYEDAQRFYKERVTMTYLALEMMDLLILLVFGEDKKKALEQMFEEGAEEEIPARFYKRPEISKKTLLITDQRV
jgi:6-phosphogluconolactonase/glucosamine-6-phosphate isomerase/deaminase